MNGSDRESIRSPDPRELCDRGLELFARGRLEESVAVLREAFFGNLFIGPVLLGIPVDDAGLWSPGPSGTLEAAREYAGRRRRAWQSVPDALRYLRCLWDDPLVRREIRSYTNFCKSYSRARETSGRLAAELAAERGKFTNPRRIRSTDKEILQRIRSFRFDVPPAAPRLAAVVLDGAAAAEQAAFLERVLGATGSHHAAQAYWEFRLAGAAVRIRAAAAETVPVELVLEVADFDQYVFRLEDAGVVPKDAELEARRGRFLLLEGPGGLRLRLVDRGEDR